MPVGHSKNILWDQLENDLAILQEYSDNYDDLYSDEREDNARIKEDLANGKKKKSSSPCT
tara:strand:+ start:152 stop:331 length:180 start_codon:yes stop_codon:yes gene_type:complete